VAADDHPGRQHEPEHGGESEREPRE
jgi:hypothetical protein